MVQKIDRTNAESKNRNIIWVGTASTAYSSINLHISQCGFFVPTLFYLHNAEV